ncbi:LAMI_0C03994g1_1 [Lachancea mirantina]|uniref:LAMI_0C03994g1_1 n=1 Tax=Lachancea mirantina TaxID=1230905 RepID=A0A1G4J2H8_9SACH|nr:LAMI_0C03994g1_1 [Lachancea mirantina]
MLKCKEKKCRTIKPQRTHWTRPRTPVCVERLTVTTRDVRRDVLLKISLRRSCRRDLYRTCNNTTQAGLDRYIKTPASFSTCLLQYLPPSVPASWHQPCILTLRARDKLLLSPRTTGSVPAANWNEGGVPEGRKQKHWMLETYGKQKRNTPEPALPRTK